MSDTLSENEHLKACRSLVDGECKYYDIADLQEINNNDGSEYIVLHLNIQGLASKFDNLKILLDSMIAIGKKPDFVLLCETFLTKNNAHLFKVDGYSFVFRNRANSPKGGVAIFINNSITYTNRPDLGINVDREFESIFIEVKTSTSKLIVGEIYRIPNTNEKISIERYTSVLNQLDAEKCDALFGTDQNFDYAKINSQQNISDLFDTFCSKGYLPTITKATRITKSTATIIDNIYVKCIKQNCNITSGVLNHYISDHQPVFIFLKKNTQNANKSGLTFKCRKFSDHSVTNIENELNRTDWNVLLNMSADQGYDCFVNTLTNCLDQYAPEKQVFIKFKHVIRQEWMTNGLMKSSNVKDRLHKKFMKDKSESNWTKFIEYRNQFNRLKTKAKEMHYKHILDDYKYDMRKTWEVINELIGRTKDKTGVSNIFNIDDQEVTDQNKISNGFCNYFTSVGQKLADKIPISNKSCSEYLTANPNPNSLFFTPTCPDEILKIINSLKTKKSTGHDGINTTLIKKIKKSLSGPLAIIVNKSLETGEVPQKMKLAKIIPIYKAKDKKSFSNYRPVSLLPCFSKILEKIIHKRLYHFISLHDIFYNSQYGFRPKHSTINAVTELCWNIITSLDNRQNTLAVFLDLSKAFDTIDHNTLLIKLEHYGVRGLALEWFRNYLQDRRQYVSINGVQSNTEVITCGVPQGSVLGPLLFIIYSNDLPHCLENTKSILFADDTTIFSASTDTKKLYEQTNKDLDVLMDWFKANKLSVNTSKTFSILFNNDKSIQNTPDVSLKLLLNGEVISKVNKTKFLGITIDENLNWKEQINVCKGKISSGLYILGRLKKTLSTTLLTTIYYSMIHPYLSYGLLLWGSANKQYIKGLGIQQNKAIRSINRAKYNEHTTPLYAKNNILKLDDMFNIQLNLFMYSFSQNNLPKSLLFFTRNDELHTYRTRQSKDPHIVLRRTKLMANCFICKGPELWGKLPLNAKQAKSMCAFKRQTKLLYLQQYKV